MKNRIAKISALVLVCSFFLLTLSACDFLLGNNPFTNDPANPPEITTPQAESKELQVAELDLDNYELHKIYFTSIYSQMIYTPEGDWLIVDDWIYFKDADDRDSMGYTLRRMKLDGSAIEELPDGVNKFNLYDATYYDGWIYFISERYGYIWETPPPGTNESLWRMRPDGSDYQECIQDVYNFEIYGDWIFYQSGYSLCTVKIGDWDTSYVLYKNREFLQATWLMRTWLIYDSYIFYSINETLGGSGQYHTKMYRMNLNGTNKILFKESVSIVYDPRFIHDGYLYFSAFSEYTNNKGGHIIYRCALDGTDIITVIEPQHYVLLYDLHIIEDYIYYLYSWRDSTKVYSESLVESIRKVKLDGTDDQLVTTQADGYKFSETENSVMLWHTYNGVAANPADRGKVTIQYLFIQPSDKHIPAEKIYDGAGWESIMGYYIYNGDVYLMLKSWR